MKLATLFKTAVLLLGTGSLWPGGVLPAGAAGPPPLIGAQISYLEPATPAARQAMFVRLRQSGFNTVIFRVFHNRGDRYHYPATRTAGREGVYFRTSRAPVIADLLPTVCRQAHRAGLRVFAWMTTLRANYGHRQLPTVCRYDPEKKVFQTTAILDPAAPASRRFLVDLYRDLAANPIDGILFQDDLILRHTEGFHCRPAAGGDPDPRNFYRLTREDGQTTVAYRPAFWAWTARKSAALQGLADEIIAACRRRRPGLLFAQNVNYEVLLKPPSGRAWFAQDREKLLASATDYFFVMAYQQQIGEELGIGKERDVDLVLSRLFRAGNRLTSGNKRVVFKLQTLNWHDSRPESGRRMAGLLRLLRQSGRRSVILMPYNRNLFARQINQFAGTGRRPGGTGNRRSSGLGAGGAAPDDLRQQPAGGKGTDERQAVNPAAPGFHQLTADNGRRLPVAAFDEDVRLEGGNHPFGVGIVENGDVVHRPQTGQHAGADFLAEDRPRLALQPPDGGIRVDGHHQEVAQLPGLFQVGEMTRVQQVETAIGEDDLFAGPGRRPQTGTQLGQR